MKKLPHEILVLIFENLHLSFKLECMLVSREWEKILRSTCLYDSIVISKTEVFNRFVQILEEQSHVREQVKELVLLGGVTSNMNEVQFYKLFFNLRSIYLGCGVKMRRLGHAQNNGRSVLLNQWSDQMQRVKVFKGSRFVYTLLTQSVCSNLTTLSIGRSHFNEDFIKRLTNALNLKKLTMIECQVSKSHAERIHAALPTLQSLELLQVYLIVDGITDQINPANSLKAVDIHFINTEIGTILHWLQYMSKKYTNISMFSFVHSGRSSLGISNENTVMESGILPALQKLCHLKCFKINCPTYINSLFYAIELSNSKIEELNLIANYSNTKRPVMIVSDSYRLITKLILKIDSTKWFYVLQHMEFIKTLEVRSKRENQNSLDLNELIKQCPKPMESLMIKWFKIVCKDQSFRPHQLNTLGLNKNSISQEVYSYISSSFPNLRHLELEYWGKMRYRISLCNLILCSLRITIHQKSVFIAVTTCDNSITKFYRTSYDVGVFENYDSGNNYYVIKPTSIPDQEIENSIQFFFGSIKTLFINNHLAY
jgi:hypothetical protein